jgi:hypothetical protein
MNNWFTVKVKYTKQLENGAFKRVSEPYLLAAMTFTDAEARIYEELGSIIRGEFSVTNIARTDYHDIFHYEDSDLWFKCKVSYESQDVDTDKKKKVSQNFLVSAFTVKDAYERINESLSTLMVDFQVPSIVLSPIVDIFPFNEELDREIERKPFVEDEFSTSNVKGGVYSAAGSDFDKDDLEEEAEGDLVELDETPDFEGGIEEENSEEI